MTMGIDAGLNASLRVVVVDRHGIDVFCRYGLLEEQTENTYNYDNLVRRQSKNDLKNRAKSSKRSLYFYILKFTL